MVIFKEPEVEAATDLVHEDDMGTTKVETGTDLIHEDDMETTKVGTDAGPCRR